MLTKLLNRIRKEDYFRVTAITIARNEELFIGRHIEHLISQGIEVCLIDNESIDDTLKIAETYRGKGLLEIVHLPYPGEYNLDSILKKAEEIVSRIDSDWFIFLNPDEFPFPDNNFKTLKQAFKAIERQGYNSVNFDEFVFLPENDEINYEGKDFLKEMKYYYFFDPSPLHRVIAWKKSSHTDIRTSASHHISIPRQKIYPTSFVFRHYILLSKKHAIAKYGNRLFSKTGLSKGWHGTRVVYTVDQINLPPVEKLKFINEGNNFDKSDPQKKHLFFKSGDHFSRYKQKYILGKGKNRRDLMMQGSSANYLPVIFIIGYPGPGLKAIRLLMEELFPIYFLEANRLFECIFSASLIESAEDFFKTLEENQFFSIPDFDETTYRQKVEDLKPFSLEESIRMYYRRRAGKEGSGYPGDSSSENNLWIAGIQNLLPEAHFINIIEDGRKLLELEKLGAPLTISEIENLSTNWLISIMEVKQQSQFCRHFLEIKMEEFIKNPVQKVNEIALFLGIEPGSQKMKTKPGHVFSEYFEKIYAGDINGNLSLNQNPTFNSLNLSLLTREEIACFESISGLALNDLGYTLKGKSTFST